MYFNILMANRVHEIYGNRLRIRACGLLIEKEELLMVNHQSISKHDFWAPPGGGVGFGESIEACLVREMLEETGLKTEVLAFLFVCEFIEKPLHAIELFFLLRRIGGSLVTGHDPEMKMEDQIIQTVRFLDTDEIRIMDPATLHGIFRFVKEPLQITGLRGYFKL